METVFVGNLSYFCTNAALVNFFSQLGPVQNVNVRRSKKNVPLHYGFVEMSQDMAQLACEKLNGLDFMGRKIRISIRKGISDEAPPQSMFHSLHMSFLTTTVTDQINEIFLTKVFARFGGLEDCVVKSHVLSKKHHKQGGYAFLYFKDLASAENVLNTVKKLNGVLDGVMYDAKFSCTSISVVDSPVATTEDGHVSTAHQQRSSLDASTDSEFSNSPVVQMSPDASFEPQNARFHHKKQHSFSSNSSFSSHSLRPAPLNLAFGAGSMSSNSSFSSHAHNHHMLQHGYVPSPMSSSGHSSSSQSPTAQPSVYVQNHQAHFQPQMNVPYHVSPPSPPQQPLQHPFHQQQPHQQHQFQPQSMNVPSSAGYLVMPHYAPNTANVMVPHQMMSMIPQYPSQQPQQQSPYASMSYPPQQQPQQGAYYPIMYAPYPQQPQQYPTQQQILPYAQHMHA